MVIILLLPVQLLMSVAAAQPERFAGRLLVGHAECVSFNFWLMVDRVVYVCAG
jgi:hypothetical protein